MDLINENIPETNTLLMLKATCDVKRIGEDLSLKRCNIKSLPFAFFSVLAKDPCSLSKIAKKLECSKQEASRILKRAQQYDWVIVQTCEEDRREKIVSLSATGRSLLNIGIEVHQNIESKLESCLGKDQYNQLNQLLKKAIGCIQKIESE